MGEMINLWAVLLAGIINMILGALWYGSFFGKQWMKLAGKTKEDIDKSKSHMHKLYAGGFAASLIIAYVLALFVGEFGRRQVAYWASFWIWLGFYRCCFNGSGSLVRKSV